MKKTPHRSQILTHNSFSLSEYWAVLSANRGGGSVASQGNRLIGGYEQNVGVFIRIIQGVLFLY